MQRQAGILCSRISQNLYDIRLSERIIIISSQKAKRMCILFWHNERSCATQNVTEVCLLLAAAAPDQVILSSLPQVSSLFSDAEEHI